MRRGSHWAVDINDLLDIARLKVTRSLTADECRQYLHAGKVPGGHDIAQVLSTGWRVVHRLRSKAALAAIDRLAACMTLFKRITRQAMAIRASVDRGMTTAEYPVI